MPWFYKKDFFKLYNVDSKFNHTANNRALEVAQTVWETFFRKPNFVKALCVLIFIFFLNWKDIIHVFLAIDKNELKMKNGFWFCEKY